MGISGDIRKLGEGIVTSYDMRVKAIEELANDTHKMLKDFQKDHKEMATKLEADLTRGETERLEDFKKMMGNNLKGIKDIETYVKNKLKEFSNTHSDMSNELKNALAKHMDDIRARQKARNMEVADLLEDFKTERGKMAASWQTLTETIAKRRSGKSVVSARPEVKIVKEAVRRKTE